MCKVVFFGGENIDQKVRDTLKNNCKSMKKAEKPFNSEDLNSVKPFLRSITEFVTYKKGNSLLLWTIEKT